MNLRSRPLSYVQNRPARLNWTLPQQRRLANLRAVWRHNDDQDTTGRAGLGHA